MGRSGPIDLAVPAGLAHPVETKDSINYKEGKNNIYSHIVTHI